MFAGVTLGTLVAGVAGYSVMENAGAATGVTLSQSGLISGLLLFDGSASKAKDDSNDNIDVEESPEDQGDPLKRLLRIIEQMARKLNKFPSPKYKKAWYVRGLEGLLGEQAAGHVMTMVGIVVDQWNRFYVLWLIVMACFALKINFFEGMKIVRMFLLQERKEIERKLSAYARLHRPILTMVKTLM